jgi:hypothetical protein
MAFPQRRRRHPSGTVRVVFPKERGPDQYEVGTNSSSPQPSPRRSPRQCQPARLSFLSTRGGRGPVGAGLLVRGRFGPSTARLLPRQPVAGGAGVSRRERVWFQVLTLAAVTVIFAVELTWLVRC